LLNSSRALAAVYGRRLADRDTGGLQGLLLACAVPAPSEDDGAGVAMVLPSGAVKARDVADTTAW
jgi:hypothetical protein